MNDGKRSLFEQKCKALTDSLASLWGHWSLIRLLCVFLTLDLHTLAVGGLTHRLIALNGLLWV